MNYDKIILELLTRIQELEQEVNLVKNKIANISENLNKDIGYVDYDKEEPEIVDYGYNKRDTTRYFFEGTLYPKNRLVLALVKKHVKNNPEITINKLKNDFDKSLQGSIGVIENREIAMQRKDYNVRFFALPSEIIKCKDGEIMVCTQWGIRNLPNFLIRAKELGYEIKPNNNPEGSRPITSDMIDLCYEYGVKIYEGQMSLLDAAKIVSNDSEITYTSAYILINACASMLKGEVYKRAINQEATEIFFRNIFEWFGEDKLEIAIQSTRLHNDYNLSSSKEEKKLILKLCDEYQELIETVRESSKDELEKTTATKSESQKIKIGQLARIKLRKLLEDGIISNEEIELMQNVEYTKKTFDLQYPLLLKCIKPTYYKPQRYYADLITINGKRYYMCSEWFETEANDDRPQLEAFLSKHGYL